jgi:inner centromere protein
MARLQQAAAASPASPYDSYNLDGLRSDASSDDEDDPREQIPKWAQGAALKNALYNQFIFTPPEKKVMAIFPSPGPPVLSEIFPKKKTKFRPRTSSAIWEPSPGRTNIHKRY